MFTGLSDGLKDVIRLDVDQNDGNLNTFVFVLFLFSILLVFATAIIKQKNNTSGVFSVS